VVRALHERLAPVKLDLRIETVDHGVVALAVNVETDVGESKLSVELCISTSRHIERKIGVGSIQDVHFQAPAAAPYLLRDATKRSKIASE